jgi:hypothetical protein
MKLATTCLLAAAAILGVHTSSGAVTQSGATSHQHSAHVHEHAEVIPSRVLVFPDTRDGRRVLSVDLHTHSVFSDGHVWPTVRTWEAQRDGLAAMAVTEHLEYQPRRDDIPHPDRNRSYQVASESAARLEDTDLIIINGAEITRKLSPGHVNAVFVTDVNPLLTIEERSEDNLENAREAIREAQRQGGFTFWNHPSWGRDFPDGVLVVPEEQKQLFAEGLIQGIEVANGHGYSEETFQVALDHDLVVLGTSDIHGLIDYDYDLAGGEHRTVTLVLARESSAEAIRDALVEGQTAALYLGHVIGREPQVRAVVEGALTLVPGTLREDSQVLPLTIRNDAPIRMILRNVGAKRFSNASDVVVVPAHTEVSVRLTSSPDPSAVVLPVEVINAFVAPGTSLRLDLKP